MFHQKNTSMDKTVDTHLPGEGNNLRARRNSILNTLNVDNKSVMSHRQSLARNSFIDYVSELNAREALNGPDLKDAFHDGTILNEEVTHKLKEENPAVLDALQSKKGMAVQLIVFFGYVLIQGLHPNLTSLSKHAIIDGEVHRISPYMNGVFMFYSNILTIVCMWIISLIMDGKRGLKACFDWKNIARLSIPGVLYAIGDVLQLIAYDNLDGTTVSIISQFRMLFSAILFRIIMKKRLTSVQWMQLICIFLLILVYFRVTMVTDSLDGSNKSSAASSSFVVGILFQFGRVLLTGPANVVSCMIFQDGDIPFYAQMAHSQMSAIPASGIVGVIDITASNNWKYFPFSGPSCEANIRDPSASCFWTYDIFILGLWYSFRQTLTCLLLKVLDVIWKGISDVMGVFCTYILAISIFNEWNQNHNDILFDIRMEIIISICILTVSYIFSKAKPTDTPPVAPISDVNDDARSRFTGGASPIMEPANRSPDSSMIEIENVMATPLLPEPQKGAIHK